MSITGGKVDSVATGGPTGGSPNSGIDGDTAAWEARLGSQVRTLRLEAGHDQVTLAGLADVGTTSLKNLEGGRGSTLATLIRVLRALDAADWLETLAPLSQVSPLDALRRTTPEPRRRVYRPRPQTADQGGE